MKTIQNQGPYLLVKFTDPYQLDQLVELMKEVGAVCRGENLSKVLVDLHEMPGKVSTMDRFQLGVEGANIFRGLAKVAVVYRKSEMNWFAETVSKNRGASVRVFSETDEAMKWLDVKPSK
jgi:hypothetical protein